MGHTEAPIIADAGRALRPGQTLPVARYRFRFRMEGELALPEYAGSLLRGQFGAALRRVACMTGAKACPGCPLLRTCPYPAIFETPAPPEHALQKFSNVPNSYVIEPPPIGVRRIAAGAVFEFGMVLVGHALDRLPLIAYALQRAFSHGLGKDRVRGKLQGIEWQGEGEELPVWDAEGGCILPHTTGLVIPTLDDTGQARLTITTPLRLQSQGRPLRPEAVYPRKLLTTLMRRAALLFEMHAALPGLAADAPALARQAETLRDSRKLHWHDWTRYSSRQQAEMTLGGVVGEWRLEGDMRGLAEWLWLGQWIHVGKNTTMGMGRYTVSFTPA